MVKRTTETVWQKPAEAPRRVMNAPLLKSLNDVTTFCDVMTGQMAQLSAKLAVIEEITKQAGNTQMAQASAYCVLRIEVQETLEAWRLLDPREVAKP